MAAGDKDGMRNILPAEVLHTLFSLPIVPAIGDLFHCLPFASFPLMMGAKVFKNAA